MKLIINIPDEAYELLKSKSELDNIAESIIANGTPYTERPQGEWKLIRVADHCGIHDSFVCPFCNYEKEYRKKNFCEECGANLRGKKADENS